MRKIGGNSEKGRLRGGGGKWGSRGRWRAVGREEGEGQVGN